MLNFVFGILSFITGRESQAASRRSRALSRVSRDARRPHLSNVLTDYDVPAGGLIALQIEAKGCYQSFIFMISTLREEHRLRVFENSILRRIFGPKRDANGE